VKSFDLLFDPDKKRLFRAPYDNEFELLLPLLPLVAAPADWPRYGSEAAEATLAAAEVLVAIPPKSAVALRVIGAEVVGPIKTHTYLSGWYAMLLIFKCRNT
jgi:hypothetical protein